MAGEYIDTTFMDGFVDGPHITEVQTGLANQGLYGPEDYVLEGGRESEAQVLTNNSIRIFDAVYVIQGRRDVIAANDYTDVSIDNGAQEMNRNDIIVRRYTKDESTEIENTEYAVIKGTPVSGEAVDPEVTEGDIRSGATQHDMKLYRVRLEGLNIVAVEPLFMVLYNAKTIKEKLDELNENSYIHTKGFLGGISSRIYDLKRYRDSTFELSAKLDSSKVSFTYSSSVGRYYALLTATLPDELSIDGTSWIFTGSIASSGIYLLTANSIQGKTLSFYLSADANPGEIEYMNIGIILKGRWK